MSPARDFRAPAENWPPAARTPKTPWPRMTVITDAPPARWADRAACAGRWDLFDAKEPEETRAELRDRVASAAKICARCPVFDQCRTFAETARPRMVGILAGKYHAASPHTSTERSTTP